MAVIEVELPDNWRPWQAEQWQRLKRFNVLVVHRRAGKTEFCLLWLLAGLLEGPGRQAAYIAPQQNQVRKNFWPAAKRLASQVPGCETNELEMRITFPNGSRLLLLGAENAHAIRGAGYDRVVLDEVSQIGPLSWGTVIRPALADRQGSAIFIGTPLGMSNLFYELYEKAADLPDWHRCLLTWQDTGVLPPEEVEALKREMSAEDFAQEMECSWSASVRGAYYAREMAQAEADRRIGRVPHDPLLPVHTSWDLGMSDLTVIWYWQVAGAEIRAIDLQAYQSTSLPEIVSRMPRHYRYGQHYAPHDAKVRELGSGKSRQEIVAALGVEWTIVPQVGLQSGIEATRGMLGRVWFDRELCKDGVDALKTYRTEYDDVRRVYSNQPLHSWESHYADSVRMFAVSQQGRERTFRKVDYSGLDKAVI